MQEVLNHLENAHAAAKREAVNAIDNDQDVPQQVLDTIKAIYALKQAVKQVLGQ